MEFRSTVRLPTARWTLRDVGEFLVVLVFFFVVAGNAPPAVNEAHYLIKSRHFWDAQFLASDPFVTSGNAHLVFYATFGWLTKWFSLPVVAWIGRMVGWGLIASGLVRLARDVVPVPWACAIVALVWVAGVREANLAGEWVIGGIEAKVIAFGFVLWGWSAISLGNPTRGWVYLGLASAFHVLVGGWCVIATLIARNWPGPRASDLGPWTAREFTGLVIGGALSLFGVIPGLGLGGISEPDAADWAAQIQVYGRLTHHLNPASFPIAWFLRHGVLVGAMVFLGRWETKPGAALADENELVRLRFMVRLAYAGIAVSCIGLIVGVVPVFDRQLGANLLRFYWFRLGDAIFPLVLGFLVVHCLLRNSEQHGVLRKMTRGIAWTVVLVSVLVVGRDYLQDQALSMPAAVAQGNLLENPAGAGSAEGTQQSGASPNGFRQNQDVYQEWLDVCQWIRQRTPADAVFITPRHQQTFKWYAERSEVVNWKDIPQDASSIVDWGRRLNRVFPVELGRRHPPSDFGSLEALAKDYGATFLVIDRRWLPEVAGLERIYPEPGDSNQTYWVYRLPESAFPAHAID